MNERPRACWAGWWPLLTFLLVFLLHACYLRHTAMAALAGWADSAGLQVDNRGFGPYFRAQDYFTGASYALGAAFTVWAAMIFFRTRTAAAAIGAAGGVTFVGILMAAGCFLVGCCGSPMLAVYVGLFGAKAFGVGKPLMALITLASVGVGYWLLTRRLARATCAADCCCPPPASEPAPMPPAGANACCSGSCCCDKGFRVQGSGFKSDNADNTDKADKSDTITLNPEP